MSRSPPASAAPAEPPTAPAAAAAKPARPHMADLARLAQVSVSTVSRALNNHPRISLETRHRIHTLAKSLHYEVDAGAQMMRGKPPQTVAVAFPYHPVERQHFQDPFFMALVGSIGDALVDSGHQMLIVPVASTHFERLTKPYDTRQAIGTLLLGQDRDHDRINALAVRDTPLVVWGARLPDQRYCTVGSDNVRGGQQATDHLLAHGARRIAFFGDPTLPEMGQRHQGYVLAHQAHGLVPDPALLRHMPFTDDAARREVDRLLAEGTPFDAVFACSDRLAMAALSALAAHGRRVPDDVQVVGYDDIPLAALAHPALTTVRQEIAAAGKALVRLLLARLRGEVISPLVLPATLVIRQSTRASGRG